MCDEEVKQLLRTTNAEALAAGLLATREDAPRGGWAAVEACLAVLSSESAADDAAAATALILSSPQLRKSPAPLRGDTEAAAFRRVLQERLSLRVLEVRGDGNCLFRAVVRALFAPLLRLPRGREDALSLRLRTDVNSGREDPAGFVVAGVNDAATMAQAGVWADAVQVAKLCRHLRVRISVARWDDPALVVCSADGRLLPGTENRFGEAEGFAGEGGITLLFTPSPGHYEALVPASLAEPDVEAELLLLETAALDVAQVAAHACNALLLLEVAVDELCDLWAAHNAESDVQVRQVIAEGLAQRGKTLTASVARLRNALSLWPAIASLVPADGREAMVFGLAQEIAADELAFVAGEEAPLVVGSGPLSSLHLRITAAPQSRTAASDVPPQPRVRSNSWSHRDVQPHRQPPPPKPAAAAEDASYPTPVFPVPAPTAAISGTKEELVASPSATEEKWRTLLKHEGNTLQFRHADVNGIALEALLGLVRKGSLQVRYMEFFYSSFDDLAAFQVFSANLSPLSSVVLDNCRLPSTFEGAQPPQQLRLKGTTRYHI